MDTNRQEIATRRQESTQPPQTERKHPPEYERDLNPDRMEGQNIGTAEAGLVNAYERKEMHRVLRDFDDDELRSIPVLSEGQRLQQGATYLDLDNRDRGEFTATGEMEAMEGPCIIPKDEVPYTLGNRLRGDRRPEADDVARLCGQRTSGDRFPDGERPPSDRCPKTANPLRTGSSSWTERYPDLPTTASRSRGSYRADVRRACSANRGVNA